MGSADIVPGVSGGTVALVLGIYERLIDNIHRGASALRSLLSRDGSGAVSKAKSVEWGWLLSLLAGILIAIAALSAIIEQLLDEQAIRTSSVFLGLVAGSVVIAWRLIDMRTVVHGTIAISVGIALFLVLGLRSDTHAAGPELVTRPIWVFVLAGALAICAMILPGISGSFILVMIGMYTEIIGAVNDRNLAVLAATGIGCIIGLAAFSTLLNWLLEHHHDVVIAAMVGLMLGSVRVLWPWPNGTSTTSLAAPQDDVIIPFALMIVAAAVVVFVERISSRSAPSDS
jgi:putative membrane protein